jgi:hypothetical protein
VTTASWMAAASRSDLLYVFRSDTCTPIPLLDERISAINHAGRTLIKEFDGSFINFIAMAKHSSQLFIELVADKFPSFNDTSIYKGRKG